MRPPTWAEITREAAHMGRDGKRGRPHGQRSQERPPTWVEVTREAAHMGRDEKRAHADQVHRSPGVK